MNNYFRALAFMNKNGFLEEAQKFNFLNGQKEALFFDIATLNSQLYQLCLDVGFSKPKVSVVEKNKADSFEQNLEKAISYFKSVEGLVTKTRLRTEVFSKMNGRYWVKTYESLITSGKIREVDIPKEKRRGNIKKEIILVQE